MPGLVTYVGKNNLVEDSSDCFSEVSGVSAASWKDEHFQSNLYVPQKQVAYELYEDDSVAIQVYGDLFSHKNYSKDNLCKGLVTHFKNGNLSSYLTDLNGYFVASIYCKIKQEITMVSDRFGHRPLYIWQNSGKINGFSSELKGLLLHPNHKVEIDRTAVDMYVDLGNVLADKTLFLNLTRIPPATMITVNKVGQIIHSEQYWCWSKIQKNKTISFDSAVDRLYELFDEAMSRSILSINQKSLSITLSGGLDSRVLLAGAKKYFNGDIATFTFGQDNCDDAVIAKQVSDEAGVKNHLIEINQNNWFDGREAGVWRTDGLKNILHMHALSAVDKISEHSNYLFNGYVGDLVLGGSYLIGDNNSVGNKMLNKYEPYTAITQPEQAYFQFDGSDPFFLYNRCVKFVSIGSDLLSHKLNNLKPFIDNDLLEFAYSLPDEYRVDSKLYNTMLLKYYPEYFATIPWQKTGKPISMDTSGEKVTAQPKSTSGSLSNSIKQMVKGSKFELIARKIYRKLKGNQNYASYEEWLREPDFKQKTLSLLLNEKGFCVQILGYLPVKNMVEDYYAGRSGIKTDTIGSLITLEMYLIKLSDYKNIQI